MQHTHDIPYTAKHAFPFNPNSACCYGPCASFHLDSCSVWVAANCVRKGKPCIASTTDSVATTHAAIRQSTYASSTRLVLEADYNGYMSSGCVRAPLSQQL